MEFQTEAEIRKFAIEKLGLMEKPEEPEEPEKREGSEKPAFDPEEFKSEIMREIQKLNVLHDDKPTPPENKVSAYDALNSIF